MEYYYWYQVYMVIYTVLVGSTVESPAIYCYSNLLLQNLATFIPLPSASNLSFVFLLWYHRWQFTSRCHIAIPINRYHGWYIIYIYCVWDLLSIWCTARTGLGHRVRSSALTDSGFCFVCVVFLIARGVYHPRRMSAVCNRSTLRCSL